MLLFTIIASIISLIIMFISCLFIAKYNVKNTDSFMIGWFMSGTIMAILSYIIFNSEV